VVVSGSRRLGRLAGLASSAEALRVEHLEASVRQAVKDASRDQLREASRESLGRDADGRRELAA